MSHHEWLAVHHGDLPFIVSFPHTGTEIPADIEAGLASPWLARKDADYWVDVLYDFAPATASWCSGMRTPSARVCRDCSKAYCRSSISALTAAHPARRGSPKPSRSAAT